MEEHQELMDYLQSTDDTSLQIRIEAAFVKALLLSASSYFEDRMTSGIMQVFKYGTNGSDVLVSFVRIMAIERKYHQWFDWRARNANRFFGAFGPAFSEYLKQKVSSDPTFDDSIKAFLELGNLRNQLVHENFALFKLEKTVAEVFVQYEKANKFVEGFLSEIQQYINDQSSEDRC